MTALQLDFKCVYSFFSRAYLLMSFLHVSPIVCLLPSYPSMLGALCGQSHSFTFVPTDCHTFTCGGHLINTPYAFLYLLHVKCLHFFILKGHASQKKPLRILQMYMYVNVCLQKQGRTRLADDTFPVHRKEYQQMGCLKYSCKLNSRNITGI